MIDLNHALRLPLRRCRRAAGHHGADRRGDRPGAARPPARHRRHAPTSAAPGSAAPACARSSTTTSRCRRTRAATSSRAPCASSRPATAARTSSPTGCGSRASISGPNGPTAGSSASLRSTAGSRVISTAASSPARCRSPIPRSGRTRRSAPSSWKDVVKRGLTLSKPVYAAQIALYQAYLELPNPALFTALNRDTMELYSELVPFDPASPRP